MTRYDSATGLVGPIAFEALRHMLVAGELIAPDRFQEPAFARLARVLHAHTDMKPDAPSPLDLAVLVRQALRYHSLHTGSSASLYVPTGPRWPSLSDWSRIGVVAGAEGNGFRVSALAWKPGWLANVADAGVDAAAVAEVERRQKPLAPIPVEPFAARFGRNAYRSAGQRTAIRAALLTPPGATLLVCLPTGDGKSFIFQIVAGVGYGGGHPGLTMVVVPTVALALDHERSAAELGFAEPLAYRGGDSSGKNREIVTAIRNGTQQLCFASPEAVCGPLREPLMEAAAAGRLSALVIDEAHLVEAWGNNFRSDFQVLAGVRRALLEVPSQAPPRTILLSATLTAQTVSTLKALFGTGIDGREAFEMFSAAYLRPEIDYWVAPIADEAERERRVLEALMHVPRPAILYVTERAHADRWLARLKEEGFVRAASMTGDTPTEDRQTIVNGWCRGGIDLVVGTSAFGMGIDNAHVRSVVHACVPETLDRFYQEVGRGGRDGRSSLSLVVPTQADIQTARSLNHPRVITAQLGFERWSAMFNHSAETYDPDTNSHLIQLDVAPGVDAERIDMLSDRSTAWNLRTLTLMAGAGMISLLNPQNTAEATTAFGEQEKEAVRYHPCQRLVLHEPYHLDPAVWDDRVQAQRDLLIAASRSNLDGMLQFLRSSRCVVDLIGPLYELPDITVAGHRVTVSVAGSCGGCAYCRATSQPSKYGTVQPTPFPWPPAPVTVGPGAQILDAGHRLVITYPTPLWRGSPTERRRFLKPIAELAKHSLVHNVIIPPEAGLEPEELQKHCPGWPLFFGEHLQRSNLPPGPMIILVPPELEIRPNLLKERRPEQALFLLVHEDAADPSTPGVLLRLRHGGRVLTYEQFQRQVQV